MRENVLWLYPRNETARGPGPLETVNQYKLYELAGALRQLPRAGEQMAADELRFRLFNARMALEPYCGDNPPMRIVVSFKAAKELLEAIDALVQRLPATGALAALAGDADAAAGRMVESWRLVPVRNALDKFEAVLSAECEAKPAFAVPKRGIYDTEELVNAAERALPPTLAAVIPEKARVEVGSAGRCLAFGLFTAAGFHACRGVEAVLEAYHQRFSGDPGTLKSWNDYHKELMALMLAAKAGTPAPSQQAVAYIDQLRQFSRNPLMHPRVVLGEEDAFMLFDLGKVVICHMAQDLRAAGLAAPAAAPDVLAAAK